MTNVGVSYRLTPFQQHIEFAENTTSQRHPIRLTFETNFISARVDAHANRPFEQTKRLFTVSVECDGQPIVVECQTVPDLVNADFAAFLL